MICSRADDQQQEQHLGAEKLKIRACISSPLASPVQLYKLQDEQKPSSSFAVSLASLRERDSLFFVKQGRV